MLYKNCKSYKNFCFIELEKAGNFEPKLELAQMQGDQTDYWITTHSQVWLEKEYK